MAKKRSRKSTPSGELFDTSLYEGMVKTLLNGDPLSPEQSRFLDELYRRKDETSKRILSELTKLKPEPPDPALTKAFHARLGGDTSPEIERLLLDGPEAPPLDDWRVGAGGAGRAGRTAEDAFLSQIENDPSTLNMNEREVLRREVEEHDRIAADMKRQADEFATEYKASDRPFSDNKQRGSRPPLADGSPWLDPETPPPAGPAPSPEGILRDVPPEAAKAIKKPKGGKWGKVAKGIGKWGWIPLMALEGAGYVKEAAKSAFGVGEKFFDGKSALDEFLGQKRQEQAYNEHQQKRMQALQQLKIQNRMRMMQVAPHLAQSLLAGRELPEDGVVIGGTPRIDLLDQVAESMGAGMFQQQGM